MSVVCLTGWQQKQDALRDIAPEALHFSYADYDDVQAAFKALPPEPRFAIGWSLGGQLLVRAIALGHMKPKALLLIGPSFQGVADAEFQHALPQTMFKDFRKNYTQNAKATATQINALIALGDTEASTIARRLQREMAIWKNGLYWLDELGKTRCGTLDYAGFPPTIIVHGQNDKVNYPEHAHAFCNHIKGGTLLMWQNCGHAPHLHDTAALKKIVSEHV